MRRRLFDRLVKAGLNGLPTQIDDDNAAIGIGLIVVDRLRWAGSAFERKLETRLLMTLRALTLFSLPNLLDDERRKHQILVLVG